MHCLRRWQNRSQLPSNLASPRIVPSSNTLPTVAWSRELRSNAVTICESNSSKLNQTLACSIGRRWRWPITRFEESAMTLQSGRTCPELRGKTLTQNLAEFYKKGCQEKSSPSTGRREDFCLEIQPTACECAPRFAREVRCGLFAISVAFIFRW